MRIGWIGSDARLTAFAAFAEKGGHTALRLQNEKELGSFLQRIDFLVLPTPLSRDDIHINGTDIPLCAVKNCPLPMLGGYFPTDFSPHAIDLAEDESYLLKNAALTAEGGIAAALSATERGFYGISVGVVGFGRIAKLLCARLTGFGIPITVYARREEARAEASLLGYRTLPLEKESVFEEELLFGTVPAKIYEQTQAPRALWAFDLGGGMPAALKKAESECIPVTSCRGVPGVFAPLAAGKIIYECFLRRLSEP